MKKITLKEQRANELYTTSLLLHGNEKLLDYDNPETGEMIRYAQFNTRAVKDCPFATDGCRAVCYATKGNHIFQSVQDSRERSYNESKKSDFSDRIIYTINVEKTSRRYAGKTMTIRIHESGDFYSMQYLLKWVTIWAYFEHADGIKFVFYTKSFRFFLKLNDEQKALINRMIKSGRLAMNLSTDDTMSPEQRLAYLEMTTTFPGANTYYCTEDIDRVKYDVKCDCADCGKCGTCNKTTGKMTVVKIHSASKNDMETYRKNIK